MVGWYLTYPVVDGHDSLEFGYLITGSDIGGVIVRREIFGTLTIPTAGEGDNKGVDTASLDTADGVTNWSQTLVPGLEERRAVPGSQTLWPAQDSLLPLAGHTLPWVAPLALLSDLEAHVQQGWFEDGRRTKRSCPRSWLRARQQIVSGQQASPGSQRCSAHGDGTPVREGSALVLPLFNAIVVHDVRCRQLPVLRLRGPRVIICFWVVWKAYRPRVVVSKVPR